MVTDITAIAKLIDTAIAVTEARVADLEAKVGVGGLDDMYLADKINYHLGELAGLRNSRLIVNLMEA